MGPLPGPADWLIWTLIGATLVVVLAVAAVVALVRVLRGQRPEPPSADDMAEDQAGIDSVRARLQRDDVHTANDFVHPAGIWWGPRP